MHFAISANAACFMLLYSFLLATSCALRCVCVISVLPFRLLTNEGSVSECKQLVKRNGTQFSSWVEPAARLAPVGFVAVNVLHKPATAVVLCVPTERPHFATANAALCFPAIHFHHTAPCSTAVHYAKYISKRAAVSNSRALAARYLLSSFNVTLGLACL